MFKRKQLSFLVAETVCNPVCWQKRRAFGEGTFNKRNLEREV